MGGGCGIARIVMDRHIRSMLSGYRANVGDANMLEEEIPRTYSVSLNSD
jgi:hypothetical protein